MKVEVIWKNYGTMVGIDGVWKGIDDWSRELGLSRMRVRSRLRIGWSMEEALELTKRPSRRIEVPMPKNRLIRDRERKQRGCIYCLDMQTTGDGTNIAGRYCPYEECPYHELDKYETYDEYMKATDLKGFAKALEALGLTMEEEE